MASWPLANGNSELTSPAASRSHVDCELRAAARAVTGCVLSAPSDALLAEAGLPSAWARRTVLATRMVALASSLQECDPLRTAAARPTSLGRLANVTGWWEIGRGGLADLGVLDTPIDQRLQVTLLPWTRHDRIAISHRSRTAAGLPRRTRGAPPQSSDCAPSLHPTRRPGCGLTVRQTRMWRWAAVALLCGSPLGERWN